eukprot:6038617-Pleurochrysis_carterae.AAC.2
MKRHSFNGKRVRNRGQAERRYVRAGTCKKAKSRNWELGFRGSKCRGADRCRMAMEVTSSAQSTRKGERVGPTFEGCQSS